MMDLQAQPVGAFLDELASGNATPGGGAGAGLAGAMGAALLSMVANLTIGKKKYADVEPQMVAIRERTEAIRAEMTSLAQLDAHVFERVMAAYRMKRETETQQSARQAAIQNALMDATQVPLKTALQAAELFDHAPTLAEQGNPNAVSDVGAGLLLADAALHAALLNVEINLALINDPDFREGVREQVRTLTEGRAALRDRVLQAVHDQIVGQP